VGTDGMPGTEGLALRGWDPNRYGTLRHPGDDFSFDIFSQAARVVAPGRDISGVDPMGGLPVVRSLASGGSQSAMRLHAYCNAIQPLEGLLDGFLLALDFGVGSLPDTRTPPAEHGAFLGRPRRAGYVRT
jgi:hypothetical protein